jgi:hypothetical protein
MQRSKLLLGSVMMVAVLGLGAVAVAAEGDTGGDGSLETTTTAVATSTTTTAAPTTTVAPAPDGGATIEDPTGQPAADDGSADGAGVARSTDGCDGGEYANHGDYVSSVAHDPGRAPGDVADAARSDCGKPLGSVHDDDASAPVPETGTPAAPAAPAAPAPPGNGNGKGNAYGKTK